MTVLNFLFSESSICHRDFKEISEAVEKVKNYLIDDDTKEPIPFASVGSKLTKAAVLTNEKGEFKLILQNYSESDSIKFFAIGYYEYTVSIKDLNKPKQFKLKANAVCPTIKISENIFKFGDCSSK